MARLLLILGVLAIVFWVISIVDCAVQPATRHRGVSKGAWVLIVVLLPVIGGALWFVLGRSRPSSQVQRHRAPDDDPDFLSSLGSVSEQNERIRRLEEELAKLDAEEPDRPEPPQPRADGTEDGDQRDQRGAVG